MGLDNDKMPFLGFDSLMPKMAGWDAASETPATINHWTEPGRWSSPALLHQERKFKAGCTCNFVTAGTGMLHRVSRLSGKSLRKINKKHGSL